MATVGDNNSGYVSDGDQTIYESNLPCKNCGMAFLSKSDYKFYPYCNSCTWWTRKKKKNSFLSVAMIGLVIFSIFYLQNIHIIFNDVVSLVYQYTKITGFQLRVVSLFLPVIVVAILLGVLSQLLAYLVNQRRYPYHR